MKFTRGVVIVLVLLYVFLWVLALNGVSSLTAPLAVPLVLAVLVAAGVRLNRFMGLAPRQQHFADPVAEPPASSESVTDATPGTGAGQQTGDREAERAPGDE